MNIHWVLIYLCVTLLEIMRRISFWPFLFSFFLLAFDVIYPSLRLLPFVDSGQFCHCRYVWSPGGFMWEYVINLLMDTKFTGPKHSSLY